MSQPFIVLGDRTSHGGTVISADMTTDIAGKYIARVDDLTSCPRCRGTFPIQSGAADVTDGAGKAYARHGDLTTCGAVLLSGQMTTTWAGGAGAAAGAGRTPPVRPAAVAAQTPTLCLECLAAAAARGAGIVPRGA